MDKSRKRPFRNNRKRNRANAIGTSPWDNPRKRHFDPANRDGKKWKVKIDYVTEENDLQIRGRSKELTGKVKGLNVKEIVG